MATEALLGLFSLACASPPVTVPALPFFCFPPSNQVCIFITKKRKEKREGNQLDVAPPPRISGFWMIVTNMATCNFIEISCNFLSLKIANSLLEQLYAQATVHIPAPRIRTNGRPRGRENFEVQ